MSSLTGGPTRTWTAPGDNALPWDPVWTGRSGTATVRLVALSARTGQAIKVFAVRTVRCRGLLQQNQADGSCQVLGLDATDQHALVTCPGFSRVDHGQLTRLRPGSARILAAAW